MINNPNILETKRLLLREINPEVLNNLFNTASDSEIISFLGLNTEEGLEAEKTKFKNGLTTFNRSFTHFQLITKFDQKIIGSCGFHSWMLQHNRAEIGYSLYRDESKGKGFMTEAIKPIIAFGFEKMDLHRIEALISPNNLPSLNLIKRFGFTEEGRLREHYFMNNTYEDSIVFSLLKKEYDTLSSSWTN